MTIFTQYRHIFSSKLNNPPLNGLSIAAFIMTRHDKMKAVYAIEHKAIISTRSNSYIKIFFKTNPKAVSIFLCFKAVLTLCVNTALPKD